MWVECQMCDSPSNGGIGADLVEIFALGNSAHCFNKNVLNQLKQHVTSDWVVEQIPVKLYVPNAVRPCAVQPSLKHPFKDGFMRGEVVLAISNMPQPRFHTQYVVHI